MSIIISGGCSGLGLGMAKKYSKAGARITICGRREEKVKKAQKELGSNVLSIAADVTKDKVLRSNGVDKLYSCNLLKSVVLVS